MAWRAALCALLLLLPAGSRDRVETANEAIEIANAQLPDTQRPLVDACEVALHPERFAGQRIRLRGIAVQDIEYLYLTMPGCMRRRWDGKVPVARRQTWDDSEIAATIMEARRRSTASRGFAAQGDFEGVVRVVRFIAPRNATEPLPELTPMFEVEKVDHVRLIEFPEGEI